MTKTFKDREEFDNFKQKALQRARAFPFTLRLFIDGRDLDGDQIYHEIIQETELGKKFVKIEKLFQEWEEENGTKT